MHYLQQIVAKAYKSSVFILFAAFVCVNNKFFFSVYVFFVMIVDDTSDLNNFTFGQITKLPLSFSYANFCRYFIGNNNKHFKLR